MKKRLPALTACLVLLGVHSHLASATESLGNVVFIGDSITAGVGVRDRKTSRYSTVTTRLLREKHPDVQEVNLAQSGRALCQQGAGYAEQILKREPDALVVQWGVNDQYWGFSVAQFVARYDHLVKTIRASKPNIPIVLTTLIADFRWESNQDGWIGRANVAIQEIAARYGCRVAYNHRALDHDRKYYADAIHPNNAGAEAMAKAIVAAFHAPPLSVNNLSLQFDQGREVRFMRYVFLPQREGIDPEWVRVKALTKEGFQIESGIPIAIRTPSMYDRGKTYRVRVCTADGKEISSEESEVAWSRMLDFTIDPKGTEGALSVIIERISD